MGKKLEESIGRYWTVIDRRDLKRYRKAGELPTELEWHGDSNKKNAKTIFNVKARSYEIDNTLDGFILGDDAIVIIIQAKAKYLSGSGLDMSYVNDAQITIKKVMAVLAGKNVSLEDLAGVRLSNYLNKHYETPQQNQAYPLQKAS